MLCMLLLVLGLTALWSRLPCLLLTLLLLLLLLLLPLLLELLGGVKSAGTSRVPSFMCEGVRRICGGEQRGAGRQGLWGTAVGLANGAGRGSRAIGAGHSQSEQLSRLRPA